MNLAGVFPFMIAMVGFWAITTSAALSSDASKPNIVLFFVDDLGWTDLGFRNANLETPNIDALAAESIDFEQTYVASPACSPSRATLVTGKHPARIRMVRHIPSRSQPTQGEEEAEDEFHLFKKDPAQFPSRNWLPLDHITYAEALKDQGYYNLFVGKWHLGSEEFHPINQGFDRQIGTTNEGHPASYYPPYFKRSSLFSELSDTYLTDHLTDETVAFIDEYDRDDPFMISMWYYTVHGPHVGRSDLVKHFESKGLTGKQAQFAAMVKTMDESVGRVVSALEEKGIAKNTVILFTSDQGSAFENPPYRGSKSVDTLCEGGARVPLLVKWPGVTPTNGARNQSVVQTTDLFPTLVEIAGGDPSTYPELDGVSLLQVIRSNSLLDRGQPIFAYRAYQDMYLSVREGDWKLIAFRSGKLNLYNVVEDRNEQIDLASERPQVVSDLCEKIVAWEKEMGVEAFSGLQ